MTMQMRLGMELLDVRFVGIPQDLTLFILLASTQPAAAEKPRSGFEVQRPAGVMFPR